MGGARFTVSAIAKIASGKTWTGKVSYLPEGDENLEGSMTPATDRNSVPDIKQKGPSVQYLPSLLADALPPTWKTIDGQFGLFWAMNVTHAASDALVCPGAEMDDGYNYLVMIEGPVGRCTMTSLLLGLETGAHLKNKKVSVIKTKAYQLETRRNTDLMSVDGELFKTSTVQVEVHNHLANVMCMKIQR